MGLYAIVNKENVVQRLSKNRLREFSIEASLFIPEIDDMNDPQKEFNEFPLSLSQAIELARKLKEKKEVMLNPIPDYFNGVCYHYSIYINRELIGILKRK